MQEEIELDFVARTTTKIFFLFVFALSAESALSLVRTWITLVTPFLWNFTTNQNASKFRSRKILYTTPSSETALLLLAIQLLALICYSHHTIIGEEAEIILV